MPIFEFRCGGCSAVFEHWYRGVEDFACLLCGGEKVFRSGAGLFYANKTFCPHDKEIDLEAVKSDLTTIMSDRSLSCAGCGTDGAKGACGGGNCGSCSSGGCGSGCAR